MHQVIFRLLAGPDLVGSVMRGAVRVWCGPLLLGEVSLAIRVTASTPGTGPPAVTESVPRYRKIFPSYSRDDRAIVDAFAEVARALGDQYLQDVIVLRSGERWRARLPELIEEADIFQLFWSSNSMRSRYCREEWEHALALRRPLFVRPLYWEDPLPQDPARGLPPDALRELEFVKVQPHPLHGGAPASSGRAPETGPDPVAPAAAGPAYPPPPPGPARLGTRAEAREALNRAVTSYGLRGFGRTELAVRERHRRPVSGPPAKPRPHHCGQRRRRNRGPVSHCRRCRGPSSVLEVDTINTPQPQRRGIWAGQANPRHRRVAKNRDCPIFESPARRNVRHRR